MLIKMAGIHGIPAVQLSNGGKMNKPVGLYSLPEGSGGVCGHLATNQCYF